ncbi:aminoglycoside 3'-phosphotransferase [Nesterenkonia ebinurensis]|uniref:aminoglycoside 3'-phosphotransferase n=1 Tax=Nesterenkonia ebinurensis TaxID=2608252 RepID=UPI001CC3B3D2|nr:aminoglycoside 3'-phosphotransferase [Nesterenkonia ebinurensis]
MSLAGAPHRPVMLPPQVRELAAGDTVEPVWRNELGGVTFRLTGRGRTRYLKWQDYSGLDPVRRRHVNLGAEAERLVWARRFAPVPEVLKFEENDAAAWLLTAGIQALPALHRQWLSEPETAVGAIASGLRRLHDSLPVEDCPFRGGWAEAEGVELPSPEKLVVCHGDPCVPNTLISAEGQFAAHVDLGQLGVADRWADLAIATYSISWEVNFGRSYDELFFAAYGAEPDEERIAFYRTLWDS